MHPSKLLFWLGFSLAAVPLTILFGSFVYFWFFQDTPVIQDPSQPRPEMVAEGISILPVYLFLGAMAVSIGLMATGWLMQPDK
ncbi:hypothetical protein TA3x_001435 [Tundrisphaera sp. TA3]|uniref:hypothetical protein n=1 Tax=Tundrisphaera sp. TA3 TaxID=3435775 RepID=UPI003EB80A44